MAREFIAGLVLHEMGQLIDDGGGGGEWWARAVHPTTGNRETCPAILKVDHLFLNVV